MTQQLTPRPDGQIKIIIGKTRCGKTSLLHEIMEGVPRILAWDPQGQIGANPGFERFRDLHSLTRHLQRTEEDDSPMRIAFQYGLPQDFNAFAKIAYAWGVQGSGLVVVEEIGDVVAPGHSGRGWGTLVSAGLKYGISIVALTQRPQRIDKNVTDNESELIIFMQGNKARQWFETEADVPPEKIPTEKYRYIVLRDDEYHGPYTTKPI